MSATRKTFEGSPDWSNTIARIGFSMLLSFAIFKFQCPLGHAAHDHPCRGSAEIVDQTYTPSLKLPGLSQFKCMTTFYRREERFTFTCDQRIENYAQFIQQPSINKACRYARAADQINVLTGLLLEDTKFPAFS